MENVTQRSYGFCRVSKRYVSDDSVDEQELVILPIPNPNTVLIDPDAKQPGRRDMTWAFLLDNLRTKDFKKRWKNAEVLDFSTEIIQQLPLWLKEDSIQVAEYWRIESEPRTRLKLDIHGGFVCWEDELEGAEVTDDEAICSKPCELPDGVTVPKGRHKILARRDSQVHSVMQYITNGVEILEENPQDGRYIAIAACFGKERYVNDGAGDKLQIESLVRQARNPFMAYCYAQTTSMELLGMMPKALWSCYEGQFEGHEDEVASAGHAPIPFIQFKAKTEETGEEILPPPQWNHWDVPLQSVEVAAESYKRAIQSSMGMYNTSVGKHDTSAQSGVAVRELDDQSSQGSFHFIDAFDGFLEDVGRILDDQIDYVYDTPRDVGVRMPNGDHKVVRVNEAFTDPQTGETYHYRLGTGRHSVSISTGPSSNSQRQAASEFADQLAQNQMVFPRIADLVVKLKNLGPIGDEISDRLVPADIAARKGGAPLPPQAQQMMSQQKQQLMQQAALIADLQKQLEAKLPEIQSKQAIAALQEETKRQDIQAQLRIAELQAGVQSSIAKLEAMVGSIQHSLELMDSQADRDHEATLQQQAQDAQAAANPPAAQGQAGPTAQPSPGQA